MRSQSNELKGSQSKKTILQKSLCKSIFINKLDLLEENKLVWNETTLKLYKIIFPSILIRSTNFIINTQKLRSL